MTHQHKLILFFTFLLISFGIQAATITVNTASMDEDDTDGLCSLYEAVIAANDNDSSGASAGECVAGDVGLDEIVFDLPTGVAVINTQGIQLNVFEALSVTGPGADLLTLDAQQMGIFFFTRAALSLKGLTLENALGYAGTVVYQADPSDLTLSDCVINNNTGEDSRGGAVRVLAGVVPSQFIIKNCVFSNNSALENGGAIAINAGMGQQINVQIEDSVFFNNLSVNDSGGAISAYLNPESTASLNIHNSRFEQNSTAVSGGALYLRGPGLSGIISSSTFYNNHADYGGGAVMWFDTGVFYSINNTFYGNTADRYAGAIYARPNFPSRNTSGNDLLGIHFINNTITNNSILTDVSSLGGGGIFSQTDLTTLSNTVIANNTTMADGPECSGSFTSRDYNFVRDRTYCGITASPGDMIGIDVAPLDPMLNVVIDDMELHVYQAPSLGSPLIDAGNPSGCLDETEQLINRDQLGRFRHQDGSESGVDRCDIGAIEVPNSDVIFKDVFE